MILLDNDIITHLLYANPRLLARIERSGETRLATTVVSRFESLRGRVESLLKAADEMELRTAADRFQQLDRILSDFQVVGLDDAAITHFGRLRKQKNLKKIGRSDLLIACIVLAHDALLVTRNLKDYKDVAGLRIENWVD